MESDWLLYNLPNKDFPMTRPTVLPAITIAQQCLLSNCVFTNHGK